MLTEKEKDKLAELNGFSEERRVDKIKERIEQSEYDEDKEHAIKRKTIKALVDNIVFGKPISEADVAAFLKYHEDIEKIKEEASVT